MQQGSIPSKIVGIQFSLFSPEEIEKQAVVEVTSKETYVGLKPKIGGLFDHRMGVLEHEARRPDRHSTDCPPEPAGRLHRLCRLRVQKKPIRVLRR